MLYLLAFLGVVWEKKSHEEIGQIFAINFPFWLSIIMIKCKNWKSIDTAHYPNIIYNGFVHYN